MTQKHNILNYTFGFVAFVAILVAIALAVSGCTALKVTDYGHEVVRDSDGKPLVDKDGKVQTVHKGQRWHYNKNMVDQSLDDLEFTRKQGDVIGLKLRNYKDELQGRGLTGVEQGDRDLVQRSGGVGREDRSRNRHLRRQHSGRGWRFPPEEVDCKLPLQGRQRGEGEDHLRGRQLHDHRRHDHRNLHGLLRKVT